MSRETQPLLGFTAGNFDLLHPDILDALEKLRGIVINLLSFFK